MNYVRQYDRDDSTAKSERKIRRLLIALWALLAWLGLLLLAILALSLPQ